MIVGWSIGGVLGPMLAAALISGSEYTLAFTTIAIVALAAIVLPLITRAPKEGQPEPTAVPATQSE
jgi:MFS transporter, OFA family, oxalate/formate antiporter